MKMVYWRPMDVPIRVSRDRVFLYGATFFVLGLWQIVRDAVHNPRVSDWTDFWSGGATVGTPALLTPSLRFAFQVAHGFHRAIWPYPPAFAWLYEPASHLSVAASFSVNIAVMLALAALAGWMLANAFEMPGWFGVVLALAWAPVKVAAFSGQNTPLALLLIAFAIAAAKRERPLILGMAVGLLLYKPTIALPFVILLLARRQWRALLVVLGFAIVWYLAGVAATGGNWSWIPQYVGAIGWYYTADFAHNAPDAVSLPELLIRSGSSVMVALAVGVAAFVAALWKMRRLGMVDALSVVSVLAVATSLHAWNYEPVIMLPAIFYGLRILAEPARTWLLIGTYALAVASIFSIPGLNWNLLLVVVLVWAAMVVVFERPTLAGVPIQP